MSTSAASALPIEVFITITELEQHTYQIRAERGKNVTPPERINFDPASLLEFESKPMKYGEKLYKHFFVKSIQRMVEQCYAEADLTSTRLSLWFRLDAAPSLRDIYWETLYNEDHFFALDPTSPINRIIDRDQNRRFLKVESKLRILVTLSHAAGENIQPLFLNQTREALEAAIRPYSGSIDLQFAEDASLDTLNKMLKAAARNDQPFHVWHFAGHSQYLEGENQNALLFEASSASRRAIPVTATDLAATLRPYIHLNLIYLDACRTNLIPEQFSMGSLALAIGNQGFPAVIATHKNINDFQAGVIAGQFYSEWIQGYPIDVAMVEARRAIHHQNNDAWYVPVLYLREYLTLKPVDFIEMIPVKRKHVVTKALRGEEKEHKDIVPAFEIGKYPITNAQYQRFIQDTGHPPPNDWTVNMYPSGTAHHPVVNVSLVDAYAFCEWLKNIWPGRWEWGLPTRDEWISAGRERCDEDCLYPWGNDQNTTYCNVAESGKDRIVPVYDYERNGPNSIQQLIGNVAEWTTSTVYAGTFQRTVQVICGGSYRTPIEEATLDEWERIPPEEKRDRIGFRVVRRA